jgi:hypothetical protein
MTPIWFDQERHLDTLGASWRSLCFYNASSFKEMLHEFFCGPEKSRTLDIQSQKEDPNDLVFDDLKNWFLRESLNSHVLEILGSLKMEDSLSSPLELIYHFQPPELHRLVLEQQQG